MHRFNVAILHFCDAVGKRKNPAVVGDDNHAPVWSAGAFFE